MMPEKLDSRHCSREEKSEASKNETGEVGRAEMDAQKQKAHQDYLVGFAL